jgi:acyl dehydratase
MTASAEHRRFTTITELEAASGEHLGYSDWITVTQAQISEFAETTGDRQWIHIDAERARSGPFGTTVAHGFLTLSLVSQFLDDVLLIDAPVTKINYGTNKTRFPAPVPVDSRVRGGVEIVSCTRVVQGFQLLTRVTVEIEGSEKPACATEMVTLLVSE